MTGIEKIAQEREEQKIKHGWSLDIHEKSYRNGELIEAALYCLDPIDRKWPIHWDVEFEVKILNKTEEQRIVVAGAFCAFEVDNIQHKYPHLTMNDGVQLIEKERQEQIHKHGYSLVHDDQYTKGQLIDAAVFALTLNGWPKGWGSSRVIGKKAYKERVVIAGAFLAAELDRRDRLN